MTNDNVLFVELRINTATSKDKNDEKDISLNWELYSCFYSLFVMYIITI